MPSFDGFTLDSASFQRSLRDLSALTNKSQAELLEETARTTLSNPQGSGLLQITPPASEGATGKDAQRQGEAAIDRDLAAVFVPVKLKHKRKEQWADVEGIHDERFRSGSRFSGKLTRGRSQPYYVDRVKLRALRRLLFSRVGFLASGWIAAAQALGARVPAWIARHGLGRGAIRQKLSAPRFEIEMSCDVPPHAPAEEMERRVGYALEYAQGRLDRRIAYLVAKDAGTAGFKASA